MRKLATIREVASIEPIPGADAIECAQVDGWQVVVKKGEFKAGDCAVYFEIDSWIPENIAPFLYKGREYNDVKGAKLKTAKLRGRLSQGLLMPLAAFPTQLPDSPELGLDVTDLLGVQKWEAPETHLGIRGGRPRGNFPSFLRKTDQERVQNLAGKLWHPIKKDFYNGHYEVTEKLDGTSLTVYSTEAQVGVCSRNLDLQETEDSLYWSVAKSSGAVDFLRRIIPGFAIQGEIVGPSVQKNPYKLNTHEFFVFDVYDIKAGAYLLPAARALFLKESGLKHVPVLVTDNLPEGIAAMLAQAEGKSVLNDKTEREGLVWKHMEKPFSFKAISNKFLLKAE
jgi:RNA ligase (TIGR02306 family)